MKNILGHGMCSVTWAANKNHGHWIHSINTYFSIHTKDKPRPSFHWRKNIAYIQFPSLRIFFTTQHGDKYDKSVSLAHVWSFTQGRCHKLSRLIQHKIGLDILQLFRHWGVGVSRQRWNIETRSKLKLDYPCLHFNLHMFQDLKVFLNQCVDLNCYRRLQGLLGNRNIYVLRFGRLS